MSKFLKPKTGVVYHCMPVEPSGDFIRPSDNYGDNVSTMLRQQLSDISDKKIPLVFASEYISKCLAFGLQSKLQEKILNKSIDGSEGELVIACDRKQMMARERNITVYEINDKHFVKLKKADRQSVSSKPIPFKETKIAFHARNAEDLMRRGLQIFALNETFMGVVNSGLYDKIMNKRSDNTFYNFLGDLVREGKIIWENKNRNINPDKILAHRMEIKSLRSNTRKNNTFKI